MKNLLHLLDLLRAFTGWIFLSVILGSAAVASGIGLMGTSAFLISSAALHPSIASLQVALVGVRFFGINRGVMRYLERLTTHNVTFRLLSQLRTWFYTKIEPLAPRITIQTQGGDLLSRSVADIETLENFYVRVVSPPIIAIIITIGVGLFIGNMHASLGWGLVTGLLLTGIGVPTFVYFSGYHSGRQFIQNRSDLYALFVETCQGWMDLLAYQQETLTVARFKNLQTRFSNAQSRLARVNAFSSAANLLLANLTILFLLVLAIPLVTTGNLDGVLLSVIVLIGIASFEATQPLGMAAQSLETCLQAAERMMVITNQTQPVVESPLPSTEPQSIQLQVTDLSFRYDKDSPLVLKNISFELAPGHHIACVGVNGAGKSTIANLLLRFWEFDQGGIHLGGIDYHLLHSSTIRSFIGALLHPIHLFHTTLRQNLLLAAPGIDDTRLISALELVGLGDWYKRQPAGLDTWLGEQDAPVSAGERQQIAIARIVLQDAPIWILDEPTVNLDAENEKLIFDTITTLTAQKSLIWITHRLIGLEKMDEIMILQDGMIVERGKHEKLLQSKGIYYQMYEQQHPLGTD